MYDFDLDLDIDLETEATSVARSDTNPFWIPASGGVLTQIPIADITADFNDGFYVLARNHHENLDEIWLQPKTTVSQMLSVINQVQFLKMPIRILSQDMLPGLAIVSALDMQLLGVKVVSDTAETLVYPMLSANACDVAAWRTAYQPEDNFGKYLRLRIFTAYHKLNNVELQRQMLQLIRTHGDFQTWTLPEICQCITNDYKFQARRFGLEHLLRNAPVAKVENENFWQQTIRNIQKSSIATTNYQPFAEACQEMMRRVSKVGNADTGDTSAVPKPKLDTKSIFQASGIVEMRHVIALLNAASVTNLEKYYLITGLLFSHHYVKYVLYDIGSLQHVKRLMDSGLDVSYGISYGWLSIYFREKWQKWENVIFDLETAQHLPIFPVDYDCLDTHPYIAMNIATENFDGQRILGAVRQRKETNQGLVDITEFRRRLAIFLASKGKLDLFAGLDWQGLMLTGGCMAAIIPKYHPLSTVQVTKHQISKSDLEKYFSTYYASADVDIACYAPDVTEYVDKVHAIAACLRRNLKTDVDVRSMKMLNIVVDTTVLKDFCAQEDVPFSYQEVMQNRDSKYVKTYFYNLYLQHQSKINQDYRATLGARIYQDIYFEVLAPVMLENVHFALQQNPFQNKTYRKCDISTHHDHMFFVDLNGNFRPCTPAMTTPGEVGILMRCVESLKYRISSPRLRRELEIFRVFQRDLMSCIKLFHLPCVRAGYDGTTVKLFPSAITAYHTFVNVDIRYSLGCRDPINILEKYRARGYTTILNQNEIHQFAVYLGENTSYHARYDITPNDSTQQILQKITEYRDTTNTKYYPYVPGHKFTLETSRTLSIIDTRGAVQPAKWWRVDAIADGHKN